jgi:hypothetical protein
LTGQKYNPDLNQKLLPLFATKGQRVKQSNEKNYTSITPLKCLRRRGKQSNNIHRQKCSKIQNNRKIETSLLVAQKRGTKILQVPNPADPLKSSNREKSV